MTEADRRASLAPAREFARRDFLKTAAWAGAALSAAGIGGFGIAVNRAWGQEEPYTTYEGVGDAGILQLAYLLELLEGTFYDQGVNAGIFDEFSTAQIAAIRDHEMEHANAIAGVLGTLGAKIPAAPEFTYPDNAFTDTGAFLELAATFEPVGIGAYQGAAPALESKEILASAISIHNSECQHRTAIEILRGVDPPNNVAFEEALPLPAVQEAVAPFGITG
ncbi:Ferritin-like domain [Rubrobacter radiotolerans]|uniref:Ferritin-like domain n=1 Tax=Rubrobacter radiotolerans TaxID=42256 RepID=A0A023X3G3_RUBRA|nr:ferritin-like domain-containing protein [Rubrobacter radiotolerans]AHY46893.1 Ferritin-like domain [Rubrobacter radiotolerans]MDX5894298.1 ferritin-like domain-containing protein [Rubrobacter radiotolerans]SMC05676.1 Ferritin-like domain-containing protein [Rubrobacter radiotolerans DSM 5868]